MIGCFGLIALGTGGIKPNIANFGADQPLWTADLLEPASPLDELSPRIGDATERQRECQKTFFSLFYLCFLPQMYPCTCDQGRRIPNN